VKRSKQMPFIEIVGWTLLVSGLGYFLLGLISIFPTSMYPEEILALWVYGPPLFLTSIILAGAGWWLAHLPVGIERAGIPIITKMAVMWIVLVGASGTTTGIILLHSWCSCFILPLFLSSLGVLYVIPALILPYLGKYVWKAAMILLIMELCIIIVIGVIVQRALHYSIPYSYSIPTLLAYLVPIFLLVLDVKKYRASIGRVEISSSGE
jgi:hypothetical protein